MHDAIVSVLGEGSECHTIGEPIEGKAGEFWPNSIWMIDAAVPEREPLGRHLKWISEFLKKNDASISEWVNSGAKCDIYISYACDDDHQGFRLPAGFLQIAAQFGFNIEVSIMT